MIHWFVVNVWPTALRSLIYSVVGVIVGTFVTAPLRRTFSRLSHHAAKLQDQMDPTTPGGITDLISEMKRVEDQLDTSTPGGLTDVLNALKEVASDLEEGGIPKRR